MLFWQASCAARRKTIYAIAGALLYFLAVRAKENIITLPLLLLLAGVLLEKKNLKPAVALIVPHLAVMATLGLLYANILRASPTYLGGESMYALYFSEAYRNLYLYIKDVFYYQVAGKAGFLSVFAMFAAACVFSRHYRPLLLLCAVGFLLMLGPVLFLKGRAFSWHLYLPHFFLSLAIGALFSLNLFWKATSLLFAICLIFWPMNSFWYRAGTQVIAETTSLYKEQMASFLAEAGDIEPGSAIFIAGLEEHFSVFAWGPGNPGNAIMVAKKDPLLRFVIEKPEPVLLKEFCAAHGPKYFFRADGPLVENTTGEAAALCRKQ
jgi:hypothetical protein